MILFNFDNSVDINSPTNPHTILTETNIGDLSKKDYYQPISLEGESFLFYRETNSYSSLSYKETDKTIYSSYKDWMDEFAIALDVKEFIYEKQLEKSIEEVIIRVNNFFNRYELKIELNKDIEDSFNTLYIYVYTSLSTRENSKIIRNMFKQWKLLQKPSFYNTVSIITRNHNV